MKNIMKYNYKTVFAAAALVALTTPMVASASLKSNQFENSEVTITYNVTDLRSEFGKARIESQVRQAARKVCGKVNLREAGSVRRVVASRTCYNNAIEKAMKSIES